MNAPVRIRSTAALLVAIGLASIALAEVVSSDLHVPAARALAAECDGFEALATAGRPLLTCRADLTAGDSDSADLAAGRRRAVAVAARAGLPMAPVVPRSRA